jgi:hypothetical protein
MNPTDDQLHQLLIRAQAPAPMPADAQVILRAVRRRANMRRTLAVPLLMAVALGWIIVARQTLQPADTARPLDEQLAGLQQAVRRDELLVNALLKLEQERPVVPEPFTGLSALTELRISRDIAANMIVAGGDRASVMSQPESARQSYRSVIELFPESPAAENARRQLAKQL